MRAVLTVYECTIVEMVERVLMQECNVTSCVQVCAVRWVDSAGNALTDNGLRRFSLMCPKWTSFKAAMSAVTSRTRIYLGLIHLYLCSTACMRTDMPVRDSCVIEGRLQLTDG